MLIKFDDAEVVVEKISYIKKRAEKYDFGEDPINEVILNVCGSNLIETFTFEKHAEQRYQEVLEIMKKFL